MRIHFAHHSILHYEINIPIPKKNLPFKQVKCSLFSKTCKRVVLVACRMSSFSLLLWGKLTSPKWDLFSFMSRQKDAELSFLTFLVVQVVPVFTFQPSYSQNTCLHRKYLQYYHINYNGLVHNLWGFRLLCIL